MQATLSKYVKSYAQAASASTQVELVREIGCGTAVRAPSWARETDLCGWTKSIRFSTCSGPRSDGTDDKTDDRWNRLPSLYNRRGGKRPRMKPVTRSADAELSPPARCWSGQFHAAAYGQSRQGAVPVLWRIDFQKLAFDIASEKSWKIDNLVGCRLFGLAKELHRCSQCRLSNQGGYNMGVVYIVTKGINTTWRRDFHKSCSQNFGTPICSPTHALCNIVNLPAKVIRNKRRWRVPGKLIARHC